MEHEKAEEGSRLLRVAASWSTSVIASTLSVNRIDWRRKSLQPLGYSPILLQLLHPWPLAVGSWQKQSAQSRRRPRVRQWHDETPNLYNIVMR